MGTLLSWLFHESVPAFTTQRPVDTDTSHPPDFSIIVEEETISVHRNLLEETCHYFHCLFECKVQEVEMGTLEVKNMKADVVRTVIAYLYGEDISISLDKLTDYIDIAEMWQLIELKDELEDYIVTNIDIDINNCMHWMDIVETYHMAKLKRNILNLDACTRFRVCINSVQDDDANSERLYIDLLHRFKLTKCTPKFIELVLKATLSDAELVTVQQYSAILLRLCTENRPETENKEQATFVCISTDNIHRLAKERDATSSKPYDKIPEAQSHGCMSRSRRGERYEGHKIIAFQRGEMFYSLEFSKEFSRVHITEIGKPPNNAHGCHCMTQCGMFSARLYIQDERDSPCVLFDIPSLNYISLPVMPSTFSPDQETCLTPVFMNTTVYVVHPSKRTKDRLEMKSLDLQKPTQWHNELPVSLIRGACCYDVCTIGNKVYLIYISARPQSYTLLRVNYYDISNKTWSKCSSYVWMTGIMKAVAVDRNILCGSHRRYEHYAVYSTINNQWTKFISPDFTAALGEPDSLDKVCCVGSVSGDDKCLIIACLGTLIVYDMQSRKLVGSFEIPWDTRYRAVKMLRVC